MTLFPGNPINEPNLPFKGVGTAAATAALNTFEAAIGGADNGNSAPQTTGFRTINWDGVKLDGTDFGGGANTIVVNPGKTVVIPKNRFVSRGVLLGDPYAVSGDGFVDVNPNVANLFPAFSKSNTFAMINDNTIDLTFNLPTDSLPAGLPAGSTGTPVPAATRGFGAIFINTQPLNGTDGSFIEYFSGDRSLGRFQVPTGNLGDPEFLGELFPDSVVTRVSLTLGNGTLFSFNGVTFSGTSTNNPPTTNLVVTDDFVYAEPVALNSAPPVLSGPQGTLNAQPAINATVGAPFTGVVATFSDDTSNPLPNAKNFTAVINWGDGHITNGAVVSNSKGGFDVMGTDTFPFSGRVPMTVDVEKLDSTLTTPPTTISLSNTALVAATDSSTTLTLSTPSTIVGQPVTLTAKVTVTGAAPSGVVQFLDGSNVIGTGVVDSTGTATFTTSNLTPGNHALTASLIANPDFKSSTSTSQVETVSANVTSLVKIVRTPVKKKNGKFTQFVTITNISSNTIPGPVFFVFDPVAGAKFTVVNAAGTTQTQAPLGSPFVRVNVGSANTLTPNQMVVLSLTFSAKKAKKVNYIPRVLAGIAQP
jgi:hypothetical protein